MFLKQKRRLTKYRKKSLIFTKYNFIKPFGVKNFIIKNFIINKKRYKNLFGNPDKSLLIINFRNLLLVPGVRFKKIKSNTSLIFLKKILQKNLKKKLLNKKILLLALKKKIIKKI